METIFIIYPKEKWGCAAYQKQHFCYLSRRCEHFGLWPRIEWKRDTHKKEGKKKHNSMHQYLGE